MTQVGLMAMAVLALTAIGCNDGSTPTSPSDTATAATTVAEASISETFAGTLAPGGFRFYSFTVASNGTVNITLTAVGGAGVPSTVWLGLGLGTPNGEDCTTTVTANTPAGTAVQLTGTYAPGVYCTRVWDIGNLASTAAISVTIAHP